MSADEWLRDWFRRYHPDFVLLFEKRDEAAAHRLSKLLKRRGYSSKLVNATSHKSPPSAWTTFGTRSALLVLISGPLSQVTRLFVRTWQKHRPEHTAYAVMLQFPPPPLPLIFRRRTQVLKWIDLEQDKTSHEAALRQIQTVEHQLEQRWYKWWKDLDARMDGFVFTLLRAERVDAPVGNLRSVIVGDRASRRLAQDQVSFSVWSRAKVKPAEVVALDVFVHKPEQTASLLEHIDKIQRVERRSETSLMRTEGPVGLLRGTALTVKVSVGGCSVSPKIKLITWTGEIGSATFVLKVPLICRRGPKVGCVSIKATGLEIATIQFVVEVSKASDPKGAILQSKKTYHRTAFASYASDDRDAVLARVQGIQKIQPTLNVFLDVMTLRSGDDWKKRLEEEIVKADVFYLFWCRHARRSEWVRREWRYALRAKGIDFIDPVPLEPPDKAPPPWRLSGKKHFNDPILAFMTTSGHD